MILNWKTVLMGFIITLALYTAGASLEHINILKGVIYILAPIIGGLLVVYINKNIDYVDNIINGALSSGLAGFTATFMINVLIEPVSIAGGYLEMLISIVVTHAVMAFVIGAVMGLIGGMIGILAKEKVSENKSSN